MTVQNTDNTLSVSLGQIQLNNPILTASGTCGYCFELMDFFDLNHLGGFITKSITPEPRLGNPPQRTCETPAGLINAIGLANVGLDKFCEEKIPLLERMTIPVFVNVAGKTVNDYLIVAERISQIPHIAGLEINVSCPNVKEGGISFGTDPKSVYDLVCQIRKRCPDTYLIVKLTPNVTDICVPARAAIDAGANCLSLVNTFVGMAIDIHARRPVLANRTGGLSGPAIKPMAVYLVNKVYQQVARPSNIPLIGLGGISCADDVVEFMLAGASAVSVGTHMMINPACLETILTGLRNYMQQYQMNNIRDLTGALCE